MIIETIQLNMISEFEEVNFLYLNSLVVTRTVDLSTQSSNESIIAFPGHTIIRPYFFHSGDSMYHQTKANPRVVYEKRYYRMECFETKRAWYVVFLIILYRPIEFRSK